MAKKPGWRGTAEIPAGNLEARVLKALAEHRTQQALELAKQLHKQEPTEPHRNLLRRAYVERAQQLESQGKHQDAAIVYENLLNLSPMTADELAKVVRALAAAGQIRRALTLLERVSRPEQNCALLGAVVDHAVRLGPEGRQHLPPPLHEGFDAVVRAFHESEAGRDEAAREALQRIGLQSPFLEWKLLVRGLIAYYQQDDVRALDNWQRLDKDRLPARLAAPLRFQIDRAFRDACTPEMTATLQRATVQLQGTSASQPLRAIQAALANSHSLDEALRLAPNAIAMLQQQAPKLVARLASCYYWAIVQHGIPPQVGRYQRLFGATPDDPQLNRMHALQFERLGDLKEAHEYWRHFDEDVCRNPHVWTGGAGGGADATVNRVRALIWARMGNNAATIPELDKLPIQLPPFLANHPGRPRPLSPGPEACFRRSLELAPDRLESYMDLLEYHERQSEADKVEQAARRLLERFPDHSETKRKLGDLCMGSGRYEEGLRWLQEALEADPLDRELRHHLSLAHVFHARPRVREGRFDEARADYQAALALSHYREDVGILCLWAGCEFKAGATAQAEALLERARAAGAEPLGIAYRLLAASIRWKLGKALKARFEKEFAAALAAPPTVTAVIAGAEAAAVQKDIGEDYSGEKTHEKKILAFVDKAKTLRFSEEQLKQLCQALLMLEANKQLAKYAALGQRHFPASPFFYMFEAELIINRGPHGSGAYKLSMLLDRARELTGKLPENEREELQQKIQHYKELTGLARTLMNPDATMDMLGNFFGEMDDEFDDDDMDFDFRRRRRRRKPR